MRYGCKDYYLVGALKYWAEKDNFPPSEHSTVVKWNMLMDNSNENNMIYSNFIAQS